MEELPHKLKLELAMVIHEKMYSNVNFFQRKEKSFIAWIARLIRPMYVEEDDYVYKEGEEIIEGKQCQSPITAIVYFLVSGRAGYVLPRFENKCFLEIKKGEHFGHVDLGGEREFIEPFKHLRRLTMINKDQMIRRFTVLAFENIELLSLSLKDLLKMKLEFPHVFEDLFKAVQQDLKKQLLLKLEVIK